MADGLLAAVKQAEARVAELIAKKEADKVSRMRSQQCHDQYECMEQDKGHIVTSDTAEESSLSLAPGESEDSIMEKEIMQAMIAVEEARAALEMHRQQHPPG